MTLSPNSGVLVHIVYEPQPLGRVEVEVPDHAILTGDADREPACGGSENGLALGQRAEGIGSGEFRLDDRRCN
jgi:hypothetical protein